MSLMMFTEMLNFSAIAVGYALYTISNVLI